MPRPPSPSEHLSRAPTASMKGRSALAGVACAVLCMSMAGAGAARAFNPDPPSGTATPQAERGDWMPAHAAGISSFHRAASLEADALTSPLQQISERLSRLPLRPVTIGEAPRTPDDPEPGAGLTVFIRF